MNTLENRLGFVFYLFSAIPFLGIFIYILWTRFEGFCFITIGTIGFFYVL